MISKITIGGKEWRRGNLREILKENRTTTSKKLSERRQGDKKIERGRIYKRENK